MGEADAIQALRAEVERMTAALRGVEMSLLGVGRYKDAFMMPALVERCKEAANHAAVGLGKRKVFQEVGKDAAACR